MIPPPSSPTTSAPDHHRIPWTLVFQGGGLCLAALVAAFFVANYPVIDWIGEAQKSIEHWGFWSGLIYPLAYAVCNLLLLPGGILSVGGGFLFGLWWGTLLVLCGNLLGAAAAFWIARRLGRHRIEKLLRNHRRLRILDLAIARHGWKIVVLFQLNPLSPTSLLNYLYGLTKVSFWRCLSWIALGQIPGIFLYAFVGTLGQFGVALARGQRQPLANHELLWGAGFVLTISTTLLLGRLARRIMAEVESTATAES